MTNLNADQGRAVAGLIREYGRLLCELSAAKVLLKFLAQNQKVLVGWEQALEAMKEKPGYRNPAQALEVIAAHLEQAASEIDLNEVLKQIPPGSPTN
jgi:hypothetical protein